MPDTDTENGPATPGPTDQAFTSVMDALVALMRAGVRPEVLEAQRVLLQRLATQGDVFPSRIPPPLNITEVGGYLNLLERAGHFDMRASAVAGALGVAGPGHALDVLDTVPVGFVEVANDRPAGAVQPAIPPLLTVRADFRAPLESAREALHAAGCVLPLRAPRATLPAAEPGPAPAALDGDVVLAALGRTLEVFPGTVLIDPAADALAVARPELPATEPFRLVARELDAGGLVPEASWVARRASAAGVDDDDPALRRYLAVAPPMEAAGWYHPQPRVEPSAIDEPGTLVRFVNVTGLVAGETTLGDELMLLYPPSAVARSRFASALAWVWDGGAFAPPA